MTKNTKLKSATWLILAATILLLAFGTFSFAQQRQYSDKAWSFGVMADTQWTLGLPIPGWELDPSGENPNQVSESIAKQIKQQFINKGVKLVFQLGDPSNWAGDAAAATNAQGAQMLYDAGIGYFPVRGNHNTYDYYFETPDKFDADVPAFRGAFPQTQGLGDHLFDIDPASFSSPRWLIKYDKSETYADTTLYDKPDDLLGLSYSFDYGQEASSARFVMLDTNCVKITVVPWYKIGDVQYYRSSCIARYWAGQQQDWISERLNDKPTTHAFVMSHEQFIGSNHTDSMFGTTSGKTLDWQNAIFSTFQTNNVKIYHSAHDHLYNRSIIKAPNLEGSGVMQIISMGASTKYYAPAPTVDAYKTARETELAQQLYNVGFYIYTVDGPRVNVDYYADATGNLQSDYCYPYGVKGDAPRSCANAPGSTDSSGNPTDPLVPGTLITPAFNFVKMESFGYSLNGEQFLIHQGESYNSVSGEFEGTEAQILAGTNGSTAVDANGRQFVKAVNTGWTSKNGPMLASNILSLWGMEDLGSFNTDVYVLEMSYDEQRTNGQRLGNAGYRLAAIDADGKWVNAVELNAGPQKKKFVKGPYNPSYGLGTYGIDMASGKVWAVINYAADFAAYKFE